MHKLTLAALMLTVAIAPAVAKDKDKGPDKAERALDRIEELQDKLQQADMPERRQEQMQELVDKLVDKYGIILPPVDPPPPPPPPPPPADVVLFKDNFNRPDSSGIGNGWTQHGADTQSLDTQIISGEKMVLTTGVYAPDGTTTSGDVQSPVIHADYQTTTLTYTVEGLNGTGTLDSEWTVNGNTWIPIESQTVSAGATYTYTGELANTLTNVGDPTAYLGSVEDGNFAIRFTYSSPSGTDNSVAIDDVALTQPAPVDAFVGY